MEKYMVIIFWYLHKNCNYRCDYCYEKENNTKEVLPSIFHIDRIANALSNFPDFEINLIGGEVTLFSNLEYIINKFQNLENCKKISIVSNGSNNIEFYKKLLEKSKVNLHISIHPKYEYKKELLILNRVHTNILFESKRLKKVENIIKDIERINFNIKLVREDDRSYKYSDEEWKKYHYYLDKYSLEDRSLRYIEKSFSYCTAGYQYRIDYNGDLYFTDMKCFKSDINMYINPQKFNHKIFTFKCPHIVCQGADNCCRNIPKII